MPDSEDQDLRDIQAEETTRGKKQPKKLLSLKFHRLITQAARMLRDPGATGTPIWKLFASSSCQRTLRSFGSSSLCGGSAAETTSEHSMRRTDASFLFLDRQGCEVARNDPGEFPVEFLGRNPFPG
jgi:hypothetical protein